MFVVLNQDLQGNPIGGDARLTDIPTGGDPGAQAGDCIEVGLVNNMPDAALRPTERQFSKLLAAAGGDRTVRLHFFALDGIPRGAEARAYLRDELWRRFGDLKAAGLDALIVTGCEPARRTPDRRALLARSGRRSSTGRRTTRATTLWSCLAAHAAVLHTRRHRAATAAGEAVRRFRMRGGLGRSDHRGRPVAVPAFRIRAGTNCRKTN